MDTPRAEIVARYRERIANQERIKLTQEERHALVEHFVDDLSTLTDHDLIVQRCTQEKELLEEGYQKSTVASSRLPNYRKAIEGAAAIGNLPMIPHQTCHEVTVEKRSGETLTVTNHYAWEEMNYEQQFYEQERHRATVLNNQRQDQQRPVPLPVYLATVEALLASDVPEELTAAIAGATGRRFGEIICGTYEAAAHPYFLKFTGQEKKTEEFPAYLVLTLLPAVQVLEAIARLQSSEVRKLQGRKYDDKQLKQFNSQVNTVIEREFEFVPPIVGKNRNSIHRLRGMYAVTILHFYCPPGKGSHRFVQHFLGHVLDQQTGQRNSPATENYFHYYLVDEKGEELYQQGVRLADIPPLPALSEEAREDVTTQTIEDLEDYQTPLQDKSESQRSVSVSSDGHREQAPPIPSYPFMIEAIDNQTKQFSELIQTQIHLTQNCHQELTTISHHLAEIISSQLSAEQKASTKPVQAAPINEMQLQEKKVNQQLQRENQQLSQQVQELKTLNQQLNSQLTELETKNQQLQNTLSGIIAFAHSETTQLQQTAAPFPPEATTNQARMNEKADSLAPAKNTLGESDTPHDKTTGLASTSLGDTVPRSAERSAEPRDAAPSYDQHNIATASDNGVQHAHRDPEQGSPYQKEDSAYNRAAAIFEAIQEYNRKQTSSDSRFAFNSKLLERDFGINRPAANRFCDVNEELIERHHQQMKIYKPISQNRRKSVRESKSNLLEFVEEKLTLST